MCVYTGVHRGKWCNTQPWWKAAETKRSEFTVNACTPTTVPDASCCSAALPGNKWSRLKTQVPRTEA